MATLDSADFTELRQIIHSNPSLRAVFKSWGLSKQDWYNLLQASENWFVNGFLNTPSTSYKAALAATVPSITNAQAKNIAKIWMQWRFSKDV